MTPHTEVHPGDRVRLLLPMDNDYCGDYESVAPGTEGTVSGVDDAGTVHVHWDDDHELGLLPGVDFWVKV